MLFDAFEFPLNYISQNVTVGSVTFSESPAALVSYSTLGSASAPFTNLSTNYKTLLSSGGSATAAGTITVTLGGLTNSQQYEIQWWSSNAANLGAFSTTLATGGNSILLDSNTTNTAGGVGQYAIGTFTAVGTSRAFTLEAAPGSDPLINAVQVRAIPEPATWTLAVIGLAGMGLQFRRKNLSGSCKGQEARPDPFLKRKHSRLGRRAPAAPAPSVATHRPRVSGCSTEQTLG